MERRAYGRGGPGCYTGAMDESKPVVLLIEDDPFMIGILSEQLSAAGFKVVFADDGEKAVKAFPESHPSVLIVDVLLPKKSGLQALRDIRALPGGKTVPAVVLSNIEEESYMREAHELGVKSYLIKANMQLPEIVEKVKEAMRG